MCYVVTLYIVMDWPHLVFISVVRIITGLCMTDMMWISFISVVPAVQCDSHDVIIFDPISISCTIPGSELDIFDEVFWWWTDESGQEFKLSHGQHIRDNYFARKTGDVSIDLYVTFIFFKFFDGGGSPCLVYVSFYLSVLI